MVDWSYYDKFDAIVDKYLPTIGEGENMATQTATAISKLVYKWYNDGDVFDNTGMLAGWANNISSYANWLHEHFPDARPIMERVWRCNSEEYELLLKELADMLLDEELLEKLEKCPMDGSVYDCDEPFKFEDMRWEDDEDDDY